MNPLKRNNPNVRATDHEDRIQTLERRIIPELGLPYASGTQTGGNALTPGNFVNMGMDTAATNDEVTFAHLPVVTEFNPGATTNIDGSLVILQRGFYWLFAEFIFGSGSPAATQFGEVQIRNVAIDDPLGTPVASGVFSASGVGTHGTPVSLALGSSILSNTLSAEIFLQLGYGTTFKPTAVKPYFAAGGGGGATNVDLNSAFLYVIQLAPVGCQGVPVTSILGEGIPPTWVDEGDCP